MPYIPCAHFRGNLGPELFYPLNQFILGFGFHMFSQIPFHGTPKVLDWVEILVKKKKTNKQPLQNKHTCSSFNVRAFKFAFT